MRYIKKMLLIKLKSTNSNAYFVGRINGNDLIGVHSHHNDNRITTNDNEINYVRQYI